MVNNAVLHTVVTVRNKKGITLEQIANDTKIGIRTLRAIEQGDFKKLPGGIYDISYIRQYARAIDFDENELLAFYYAKTGLPRPAGAGTPSSSERGGGQLNVRRPEPAEGA
ncbi:MAG: helix-turn-helix domain-containing protein [Bryobacterales bacterium]|nr:helix-turn-helix domain-containing protein [Bryobacterales bacterium]